jgi:hypothetical protein
MKLPSSRTGDLSLEEWVHQFLAEQTKGLGGVDTDRTLEWWLPNINTTMALPLLHERPQRNHRRGRGDRGGPPASVQIDESAPEPTVVFSTAQVKRMLKSGGEVQPLKESHHGDDDEEGDGGEDNNNAKTEPIVFASAHEAQEAWTQHGQTFVNTAVKAEQDIAELHLSVWQPLQAKADELLSFEVCATTQADAEAAATGVLDGLPALDTVALEQKLNDAVATGNLDQAKSGCVAVLEEAKGKVLANMAQVQAALEQLNEACSAFNLASLEEKVNIAVGVLAEAEVVSKDTCAKFPSAEGDEEQQDAGSLLAEKLPSLEQQLQELGTKEKLSSKLSANFTRLAKKLARQVQFVEARTGALIDGLQACGDIEALVALCNDNETPLGVAKGLDILASCAGPNFGSKLVHDLVSDQQYGCEHATRQVMMELLKAIGKCESVASGFVSHKFATDVSEALAGLTAVRRGYRTKVVNVGVAPVVRAVIWEVGQRVAAAPEGELHAVVEPDTTKTSGGRGGDKEPSSLSPLAQRDAEISQLKRALALAEGELALQRDQQAQIIAAFAKLHGKETETEDQVSLSGSTRSTTRRNGRKHGLLGATGVSKRLVDAVDSASRARLESLAKARAILGAESLEQVKTVAGGRGGNGGRRGGGGRGGGGGGRRSHRRRGPARAAGAAGAADE